MNPAPPVTTARGISGRCLRTRSRGSAVRRRRGCCARRRRHEAPASTLCTRRKSSARKSSHSVSSTRSSASADRVVRVGDALDAGEPDRDVRARGGVVRTHVGAVGREHAHDVERRRVADVIGVRLVGEPPDRRSIDPSTSPPSAVRTLSTTRACCFVVHGDDAAQELEVVAVDLRDVDAAPRRPSGSTTRRTRGPRAASRTRSAGRSPCRARPRACRRSRLTEVRDRVDERDLGGEERVRRVLHQLGRRGIGDEDRRTAHRGRAPTRGPRPRCRRSRSRPGAARACRRPRARGGGTRGSTRRAPRRARRRRAAPWRRSRSSPTGIVDLFTTTVRGRSNGAISRATDCTNERSAAPASPWGVGTQRNTKSASRTASVAPTTKRRRPDARPSASRPSSPSSRIGASPFRSRRMRSSSTSAHTTWWPSFAKHTAVGMPTYPAPIDRDLAHACPLMPARSRGSPTHLRQFPVLDVLGDRITPGPQRGQTGEPQRPVVEDTVDRASSGAVRGRLCDRGARRRCRDHGRATPW